MNPEYQRPMTPAEWKASPEYKEFEAKATALHDQLTALTDGIADQAKQRGLTFIGGVRLEVCFAPGVMATHRIDQRISRN